jgi:pimeloyl-ACP methyl ester carboxylesterase
MRLTTADGIELEYTLEGRADAPVVLLIMGLGMQMIAWPEEFCGRLLAAGYRVLRFDNRDIGLSSKIDQARPPSLALAAMRYWLRLPVHAPYCLDDMAADSIGLLDALQIPAAHVVGVSMGGMIAQQIAALHPARCLSLGSIMSTTGAPSLPRPSFSVLRLLLARPPKGVEFERVVAHFVRLYRRIGSPAYPVAESVLRERVVLSLRRNYHPAGTARQLLAIVASGDRSRVLGRITAPTLVIHGDADPLLPVAHCRATVRAIPGAALHVIGGMGHDLPVPLLAEICARLDEHWRAATCVQGSAGAACADTT